jgi:hypothetical protein
MRTWDVRSRTLRSSLAALAACTAVVAAGAGTAHTPAPARGTPVAAGRLPSASFPYLGIRCRTANWAGCDRIGIGVHLARPAILVSVQVDGHLVTLSPPRDPGSDLWEGELLGLGPHHGPLAVRARHGYWYGEPPVLPRVHVIAYFADGRTATRAGIGYLHAGYG